MSPTPEAMRVTLRDGLGLSYVDRGDPSAPPVVLLPGLTDSWRSYERVLAHLPPTLRAVAVSQRGHGDSDRPETGYRTADFAADLERFLDALGLARAVVLGHSSSSLVAQRFALDHGDRTSGIVLVGSFATLRGNRDVEEAVGSAISALQDPIDPAFVRAFQESTVARPLPPSFLDTLVGESLKVPARVWREAFHGLLLDDHTDELASIGVPTLIVWGDRDALLGRAQQDALAAAIPRSELLVYEGTGHSPHWEEPGRFTRDLAAFVERVAGAG